MIRKRSVLKLCVILLSSYLFLFTVLEIYSAYPNPNGKNEPAEYSRGRPENPSGKNVLRRNASKTNSLSKQDLMNRNSLMLEHFLETFPEMRANYSIQAQVDKMEPMCFGNNLKVEDWTSLPMAPPMFHPLASSYTTTRLNCQSKDKSWNNECCRTIYFLGSGKCGSTTLALLLKHNMSDIEKFDPTSGFADGGKEPCWAMSSLGEKDFYSKYKGCSTPCSAQEERTAEQKIIVLDGCPRYTQSSSARRIVCSDPNAKFVMLVRDPLLRAISDYNDFLIRGGGKKKALSDRDKQTLPIRSLGLSNYHSMLKNFLTYVPPQNILIVQTEFLHIPKFVPHIMRQVQNHYGVPNRDVHHVASNVNAMKEQYTLPSKSSFESSLSSLCPKTLQFFSLVGYKFDWLLHHKDPRNAKHQVPDKV